MRIAIELHGQLASLRKAAHMALEWFDWMHSGETITAPHVACTVQKALRKALS